MNNLSKEVQKERELLQKLVKQYGLNNEKTIKQSQKLDKLITMQMKEMNNLQ